MRILPSIAIGALVLVAAAASCSTRPNPDFCCATAETCAAAGLTDELRPCEVGQACKAYECVAAECTTSAECTSPEAPTCLHGLCAAGCAVDDDCAGVAGRPRCDVVDATCVGCTSSDQCPADRAICDADTRSCRGCTADDQCASGVCIEATGRCAADEEIIYVTEAGTDAGTCPRSAPCKTMAFVMPQTGPIRSVIRILGADFHLGNNTIFLSGGVSIDGSNTTLTSAARPVIHAHGPANLEGVRLASDDISSLLIDVSAGGILGLAQATLELGSINVSVGAMLDIKNVRLVDGKLECDPGSKLTMKASRLEESLLRSSCEIVMSGNRLELPYDALSSIFFFGSVQRIENNLFIGDYPNNTLILLAASPQTAFRFNTIVNTSAITGAGYAVNCQEGTDMTGNIIAYNSTTPVSCATRHSLFDAAGVQEVGRGIGNRSADVMTFFKDRQAGDFHLSPNSPAIGFGEPGLVTADLDGNARPMPTGSLPDVGAYEAP